METRASRTVGACAHEMTPAHSALAICCVVYEGGAEPQEQQGLGKGLSSKSCSSLERGCRACRGRRLLYIGRDAPMLYVDGAGWAPVLSWVVAGALIMHCALG